MRSAPLIAAGAIVLVHAAGASQDRQTVDAVLRAAGSYLLQYEKDVSAVVAEEDCTQRVEGLGSRRLRSDLLVILDPKAGWISFRDVFEVDGKPVRDRDDRLQKLFFHPSTDALAQARRIVEEGSRFNLNPQNGGVRRTINQPFIALKFLRGPDQPRSAFTIDRTSTSGTATNVVLSFTETAKPRLINSPDGAAARGWFRIDGATGRVTGSELRIQTGTVHATIRVTFAGQAKLKLWLPAQMDEEYSGLGVRIDSRATYSNFRRFTVETETAIK
jgi:hypothetical protein